MNESFLYFLKVNIAIAVFYLFYRLVFYNDTLWIARRFYLAISILISIAYPLISLESWLEKQQSVQAILTNYTTLPEVIISPNTPAQFRYDALLFVVYMLIVVALFVKTCVQLGSIIRWKMHGRKTRVQGVDIIALDKNVAPFSFFNLIFLNPALHNVEETQQILAHEQTHARQWHSLDVLLTELLTITCWINPAAWLLKREIRQNLEFLADNKVLQSGFDSKNYQYHLLQLSYQIPDVNLANKFNISPLKKRIMKMNQQKTAKAGILKYSLIVPLALALVLSSNAQTVVKKAKETVSTTDAKKSATEQNVQATKQKSVKSSVKFTAPVTKTSVKFVAPVIKKDDEEKVYNEVEKMPQYPGGDKELMAYLAKTIRYPVKAQEGGVQGKVVLRFVIDAQGKVKNVEVVDTKLITSEKKLNEVTVVGYGKDPKTTENAPAPTNEKELLEKEALRVVKLMADWTPGEQKGKAVSVYYTLPIAFRLE